MAMGGEVGVLLRKNWLLKRRKWVKLLLEILLPGFIIGIFAFVKEEAGFYTRNYSAGYGRRTWPLGNDYLATDPYFVSGAISESSLSSFLLHLPLMAVFTLPQEQVISGNTSRLIPCMDILNGNVESLSPACPLVVPRIGIVTKDVAFYDYFNRAMGLWYPSIRWSSKVAFRSPRWRDVVRRFDDDRELTEYIRQPGYGSLSSPVIAAALSFNKVPANGSGDWDFSIRLNASTDILSGVPDVVDTSLAPANAEERALDLDSFRIYAREGFNTLMTAVNRFIICNPDPATLMCRNEKAVSIMPAGLFNDLTKKYFQRDTLFTASANYLRRLYPGFDLKDISAEEVEKLAVPLRIAPQPTLFSRTVAFPRQPYVEHEFFRYFTDVLPIAFLSAFLYSAARLMSALIAEKELRHREYLKILGVSGGSIVLSWYITYGIVFLFATAGILAGAIVIFPNSDPVLLFLLLFGFALDVIAFSFMMSTFFDKARLGSLVGTIVLFAFFFPYYSATSSGLSSASKLGWALLAPCNLGLGIGSILGPLEQYDMGVTMENVGQLVNGYRFSWCLVMAYVDFVLYTLLGFYLDQVLPKQWGTRKPWNFLCLMGRQRSAPEIPSAQAPSVEDTEQGSGGYRYVREPVGLALKQQERDGRALVVSELRKEFGSSRKADDLKIAVNSISMSMYQGEVTCLLGHNGAGKTTTMSMLTGMLEPTSGTARFSGYNIHANMPDFRRSLGYCPQHDILYEQLTVRQHLDMFLRLKGRKGERLRTDLVRIVEEVGLKGKEKALVSELSGGMKRKLSVALALMEGNKVVFLDEPTSGVDPYSRRSIWKLIRENKKDRNIVLTTHFMDEAEALGDRVAIMANGDLVCCGSSLFLKGHYGIGYNLTMIRTGPGPVDELRSFVARMLPPSQFVSCSGAEVVFKLPFTASHLLADFFRVLKDSMVAIGIVNYGISVGSIEDVFLHIAREHEVYLDKRNRQPLGTTSQQQVESGLSVSLDSIQTHARRKEEEEQGDEKKKLDWSKLQVSFAPTFTSQLYGTMEKRFRCARRDRKYALCALLLPIIMVAAGFWVVRTTTVSKDSSPYSLEADTYLRYSRPGSTLPTPVLCLSRGSQDSSCRGLMDELEVGAYVLKSGNTFEDILEYDFVRTISDEMSTARKGRSPVVNTAFARYGAYVLDFRDQDLNHVGYTVAVNTTSRQAGPTFKRLVDQAIYRYVSGSRHSINVTNHPFPNRFQISTISVGDDAIDILGLVAVICIMIALAFISASVAAFITKEREPLQNCKLQQVMSGLSLPAFWLGNFLWDFGLYLITYGAIMALIAIIDIRALRDDGSVIITGTSGGVALCLLLFGMAIMPFTYGLQTFFKDHSVAQIFSYVINFMMGVVAVLAVFIMTWIEDSPLSSIGQTLGLVLRIIFPAYTLGEGLVRLTDCQQKPDKCVEELTGPYSALSSGLLLPTAGYLALQALVYGILTLVVDLIQTHGLWAKWHCQGAAVDTLRVEAEDKDVAAERVRIASGQTGDDAVTLMGLTKVYGGLTGKRLTAVRDLWFSVRSGECFGFLGLNGAGKTTTIKMLIGQLQPTSGRAVISGLDTQEKRAAVKKVVGYCPQFDGLLDTLTVKEHLELFAALRGVKGQQGKDWVEATISRLDLAPYAKTLASKLSGGTRRKLSMAIALLGRPSVLLLDEPSTGMDPLAKRHLWEQLSEIMTELRCSVILTTHSMDEAEALSNKVGIMAAGRLLCYGTAQHLKSRFGSGLTLEVALSLPSREAVMALVNSQLSELKGLRFRASLLPVLSERKDKERSGGTASQSLLLSGPHLSPDLLALLRTHVMAEPQSENSDSIDCQQLAEFWLCEERLSALLKFVRDTFPDTSSLLERQGSSKVRFLLQGCQQTDLESIFRVMEAAKGRLGISGYSVSQTSLDQLFNEFVSHAGEREGGQGKMKSFHRDEENEMRLSRRLLPGALWRGEEMTSSSNLSAVPPSGGQNAGWEVTSSSQPVDFRLINSPRSSSQGRVRPERSSLPENHPRSSVRYV